MSRQDFSILEAVLPMRKLPNVNQGGALPRVHVDQEQLQRAINARKEEPQVHNVEQGARRQAINAGREVRHRATNVVMVVVQEHSVRLGLVWVSGCQLRCISNRMQ